MRKKDCLSLQFFDRKSPSKADAFQALTLSLELLAESLPIAVRDIGSQPSDVQMRFWWALMDFERATDMDRTGGFCGPLDLDKWREKLAQWAGVCSERIETPRGDLTIDETKS